MSRLSHRLAHPSFWLDWLRRPAFNIAEAVIRLRRLRGLSQADLAERMGTRQPAIARIESGIANLRVSTLVDLARALDATVRVELEPAEFVGRESRIAPWWQRAAAAHPFGPLPSTTGPVQILNVQGNVLINPTFYALLAPGAVIMSREGEVRKDIADITQLAPVVPST